MEKRILIKKLLQTKTLVKDFPREVDGKRIYASEIYSMQAQLQQEEKRKRIEYVEPTLEEIKLQVNILFDYENNMHPTDEEFELEEKAEAFLVRIGLMDPGTGTFLKQSQLKVHKKALKYILKKYKL